MSSKTVDDFLDRVRQSAADGTLVRLNLGASIQPDGIRNVFIRPVRLKDAAMLSFVYRHPTRDVTKNFAQDEALDLLRDLLGQQFLNAFLSTTTGTAQLTFRKGRPTRMLLGKPEVTEAPDLSHDRAKERPVPGHSAWLRELGVTAADGSVKAGMESKFRQINRFVEVLQPLLVAAQLDPAAPLHLVDMGCGKAYLTFAAYEHLCRTRSGPVTATGVEVRPDLVSQGRSAAGRCGFDRLKFEAGDIASSPLGSASVVMALHACDTATDEALAKGVRAGAALLLVSPCCHREVRPQLSVPEPLAGPLRHGIFRERHAEFATDALRALLLEWAGYETRVFEFISTEHTGKNLMIAAVRRKSPVDTGARARAVAEFARFHGIVRQRLAERLGFDLVPAAPQVHGHDAVQNPARNPGTP
jgi:hypothetical protein